jgi:restriction system protein
LPTTFAAERADARRWLAEHEPFFVDRPFEREHLTAALLDKSVQFVQLLGEFGSGKTHLARTVIHSVSEQFYFLQEASGREGIGSEHFDPREGRSSLTFVDDADLLDPAIISQMLSDRVGRSNEKILFCGRADVLPPSVGVRVFVRDLNHAQIDQLLKLAGSHSEELRGILPRLGLTPRQIKTALARLHRGATATELLLELEDYRRSGLVDPAGRPLDGRSASGRSLIADVRSVDRELLAKIARTPSLVYGVDPRKFEELTAELFSTLGYEVELTPKSKDGGRDLHVAKKGPLGSLLFYVECKRWAPHRPVKVGLVRQLHGTVQADRATAGLMVTTSTFSRGARQFQSSISRQLLLADYLEFQGWMAEAGFK